MNAAHPSTAAISLRNVSKKYQLYDSLAHRVYEALHPFQRRYHREFWALHDVTLEIPKGATVGILGVNGSGKSTLLQLICSILHPTSGEVEVRGRVAALIELGAGFNPELTGRQNVEVNCAILGLDADAIRSRLPEIEAFADIGDFFDQPVKTYSSGMFMRVAFSTAISVDPDILVIDEALSVGDARFQEKCFRKFRDFQSAGKTILLVTHDRSAVPRLCTHGLLFHRGRLVCMGSPKEVTDRYSYLLLHGSTEVGPGAAPEPASRQTGSASLRAANRTQADSAAQPTLESALKSFLQDDRTEDRCPSNPTYNKNEFAYGVGGARIIDYLVVGSGNFNPTEVRSGTRLEIYMRVLFEKDVEAPLVGLSVKTQEGALIYGVHSGWLEKSLASAQAGGIRTFKFTLAMNLGTADWFFDLAVAANESEVLHTREALMNLRTVSNLRNTGIVAIDTTLDEM